MKFKLYKIKKNICFIIDNWIEGDITRESAWVIILFYLVSDKYVQMIIRFYVTFITKLYFYKVLRMAYGY